MRKFLSHLVDWFSFRVVREAYVSAIRVDLVIGEDRRPRIKIDGRLYDIVKMSAEWNDFHRLINAEVYFGYDVGENDGADVWLAVARLYGAVWEIRYTTESLLAPLAERE